MAGVYKSYMRILEKWPVDSSRKGRDVGEYIREQIKVAFNAGDVFQGDEEKCRKASASLKRLSENKYGQMYRRKSQSSATGLTAEQCRGILSSDFMELMQEEQRSYLSKLFRKKSVT